uniref:Uncharacterized protein n=1 Tax=Arundo donax TaxID=35708 RepID=A0A0A9TVW4_ARUDO
MNIICMIKYFLKVSVLNRKKIVFMFPISMLIINTSVVH